jgi:protein-L-isoaspartate O-methyltransferase
MRAEIRKAVDFHRLIHNGVENYEVRDTVITVRRGRTAMRKLFIWMAAGCATLAAQSADEKLAPYYPTPETIVDKMLQFGGLKAGEKVYDLGSGDGRIVIMAAQKFHADAIGVELDKDLCKQSMDKIRKLGLEKTAHIINGDLLAQNYSSADLVTVYLLPDSINNKVQPLLDKQLKKGARVVAHDFEFRNWTPEKVENIADDGEGRSHTLYLYRK